MPIQAIDEIPMNQSERRESYRRMIRDDIEYAFQSGITKFEFVGNYNFKYLASYAREEAQNWLRPKMKLEISAEFKRRGIPPVYLHVWKAETDRMIRIHVKKCEDRIHVYCELFPEKISFRELAIQMIDEELKKRDNYEKLKTEREKERAIKNG